MRLTLVLIAIMAAVVIAAPIQKEGRRMVVRKRLAPLPDATPLIDLDIANNANINVLTNGKRGLPLVNVDALDSSNVNVLTNGKRGLPLVNVDALDKSNVNVLTNGKRGLPLDLNNVLPKVPGL
jgi:hypothetical protein